MIQVKSGDTHHHGNLKEALVAYTIAAADRGELAELSLRGAARDLGVSPGAAYRHFPDKNALLAQVAVRGFDALAEAFDRVVPFESAASDAAHAKGRFIALATVYADFSRNRKELWRLMFSPVGRSAGTESDRPSTYDWLAKSLDELAAFGVIGAPRPEHQFFAWSAIHGLSDLQASPATSGQTLQASIERQCALILAALSN